MHSSCPLSLPRPASTCASPFLLLLFLSSFPSFVSAQTHDEANEVYFWWLLTPVLVFLLAYIVSTVCFWPYARPYIPFWPLLFFLIFPPFFPFLLLFVLYLTWTTPPFVAVAYPEQIVVEETRTVRRPVAPVSKNRSSRRQSESRNSLPKRTARSL